MANLLDSIKSYLTPDLIAQAASHLGENESGVMKAAAGFAPTILAGILQKSGDANAMGSIFNQLSDSRNAGFLDNLGSLVVGGNLAHNDPKDIAGRLMGSLFGNKVQGILNGISEFAGIKSSSASSLMGLVGPLVMGVLGKKISSEGLNVSGLANLLKGEQSSIMGALPMGLGSLMGLPDFGGSMPKVNVPKVDVPNVQAEGTNWMWPLLLLLAIGGGIMAYMKGCFATPEPVKIEAPVVEKPAPVEAAKPKLTMPAGTQEAAMLAFIESTDTISKGKWFDFPEIMFDVNKATLKPESEGKLNNILAILNFYPKVKLKVGGYTDSDGNNAKNLKLSDDRAKSAAAWLVSKGIAAERLDAEGYGEAHPVGDNKTAEGKAMNRRISFSVRAK